MKLVTIKPIEQPKTFEGLPFAVEAYKAAVKAGPKVVPWVTAKEAIRNSGGMYEIVPEKEAVEVKMTGMKPPAEMDATELVLLLTTLGKRPQKRMKFSDMVSLAENELAKLAETVLPDDG